MKYVIFEKTIAELEDIAKNSADFHTTIYEHNIKRAEKFSEQQALYQADEKNYTCLTGFFRYEKDEINELVRDTIFQALSGGAKEIKPEKIEELTMNATVRAVVVARETTSVFANDPIKIAHIAFEYGDKDGEYSYDMDEMDRYLCQIKNKTYRINDKGESIEVYYEKIKVSTYTSCIYRVDREKIRKLIQKTIRNDFTYCFKNGEVIIPQEYIDKGEEGIKEWRELRASKNKNKSMEKQILRKMLRDKKREILTQVQRMVWRFPKGQEDPGNTDYTIPFICIDGNSNCQRCKRLVSKLLEGKTDAEILNITAESVDKMIKDYWKEVLNRAINEIDNVKTLS